MCIMLPVGNNYGNNYNVLESFTKHLLEHNRKSIKIRSPFHAVTDWIYNYNVLESFTKHLLEHNRKSSGEIKSRSPFHAVTFYNKIECICNYFL